MKEFTRKNMRRNKKKTLIVTIVPTRSMFYSRLSDFQKLHRILKPDPEMLKAISERHNLKPKKLVIG